MDFRKLLKQIQDQFIVFKQKKAFLPTVMGASIFLLMLSIYLISRTSDSTKEIFHSDGKFSFEEGRIIGSPKEIYDRKEQIFSARLKDLETKQVAMMDTILEIKNKLDAGPVLPSPKPVEPVESKEFKSEGENGKVQFAPPPDSVRPQKIERSEPESPQAEEQFPKKRSFGKESGSAGPSIIGFPVKAKSAPESLGVVIPPGSFVQAKLLTGIEAPEGKALPVLLQADYAFVGPNKTRIDLSGCFLIAKSTGNLSIERVEMQATKLSCVSKSGKMFEREVNGFVADDKDNSFAVMGSVNSKQDRVAAMAFLSSIVEGIGKAIQQAQTTTQANALGGSTSIISGDETKYMLAGGASSAASTITQWYLKQAQNLLPTINVGSGQNVWIIMQDSVPLPNWYFKKASTNSPMFSYLSRITE